MNAQFSFMLASEISELVVTAGVVLLAQSTVILSLALIASIATKRRAALRSAILRAAAVVVVVAPLATLLLGSLGVEGVAVTPSPLTASVQVERSVSPPPIVVESPNPIDSKQKRGEVVPVPVEPRVAVTSSLPSIFMFLTFAWLLGVAFLLARLAFCHIRLGKIAQRAAPAPAKQQSIAGNLAERWNVRSPRLLVSGEIAGPLLTGLRRPVILLPSGELNDEGKCADVIAHEMAHLRRRDCPWHFFIGVLCSMIFFQPLVWVLARRLEEASDEVCDDFVVSAGHESTSYARRLVAIAERVQPCSMENAAGLGIVTFRSSLGRRVKRLLDDTRRISLRLGSRARTAIILMTFVTAGSVGLLGIDDKTPVEKTTAESTKATETQTPAPEMLTVEVSVVDEDGRTVEGAGIYPWGLRAAPPGRGHGAWIPSRHGPDDPVWTNAEGRAVI